MENVPPKGVVGGGVLNWGRGSLKRGTSNDLMNRLLSYRTVFTLHSSLASIYSKSSRLPPQSPAGDRTEITRRRPSPLCAHHHTPSLHSYLSAQLSKLVRTVLLSLFTMPAAAPAEASDERKTALSTCILRFLFVALLLGGIFGVVWALVPPSTKKVSIAAGVDAASLAQFALDGNNTLDYALALNLTLWNNRRWFVVHYKKLQVGASYSGEEFASAALPAFSQASKSNSTVAARLRGQTRMTGGTPVAEKFVREKGEGYYYVDVQVDLEIWTEQYDDRKRTYRSRSVFAKVACPLKLSLAAASVHGSMRMGFQRTQCDVKFT